MRVNARLDQDHSQKLAALVQMTELKISEIIKRAIDVYYDQIKGQRSSPAEVLTASGFVGFAKAAPNLSETYKDRLTASLAAKHDHR